MQEFSNIATQFIEVQVTSLHFEERIGSLKVGGQLLQEKTSKVNKIFEETLDAMKSTKLHSDLAKTMKKKSLKNADKEFESTP